MAVGWGKNLASIWTNNVAPSRPSCSEMCVYTRYLRELQSTLRRKIKLLVLGSTPEFRDWGVEEDLDISVVDKNRSYYDEISRELRHKNIIETVYFQSWEEMHFIDKFDIILGDLAIGNVEPSKFDQFIQNVNSALLPNGLFMGKSMLWDENERIKSPKDIINDYRQAVPIHPYTFINHQLGMYCLDKDTNLLDFSMMFNELNQLYLSGDLDERLFSYFKNIGWNTEMKFKFFAPSQRYFIDQVNQYMRFIRFEHTDDCYTNIFPIYIIKGGN